MFDIADIIIIEDEPFSISIDTQRPFNWDAFKYLVQALAKIGVTHQPKPETEPDDGPELMRA